MDPNSGRKKNVTGNGKGVSKRGSGLGTGPVGRSDGYAGRTGSSGGQTGPQGGYRPGSSPRPSQGERPHSERPPQGGGQRSSGGMGFSPRMILAVIVVIILLVALRSCFYGKSGDSGSSAQYQPAQTTQTTAPVQPTQQAATPAPAQTANTGYSNSDLYSLLGFSGNNVSEGWSMNQANTASLNTEVAAEAREKRTQILGNGQDTVTIMVYMCGTDLESKSGMASKDIQEICSADLSDNVNVIIFTGGCKSWKINGISNSVNQIYKAERGSLRQLVADAGSGAMTDPNTLTAFIQWCAQNYPANRNDLIFWDHGGGSISGYGYDEKNTYAGSMTLAGINKALANAGVTYDFIGFDTCLMATLENALLCSKYADYMVASEETEPGIGWYYTEWLTSLSNDTSQPTVTTGKNIVDGFVDQCARQCSGQKATLSLTDLSELQMTVPEKLSAFSENTAELIRSDNYKTVSNARAGAREFAASNRIDQIDLVDFADAVGTDPAKELCDALLGAIKYNRTSSNMTNSYGLSIYFPYNRASKVDSVASIYQEIGMDEEYARCIKSFAGIETSGQISSGGAYSPISSILGGSYGSYGDGMTVGSDAIGSLLAAFLGGGRSVGDISLSDAGYMTDSSSFDYESAADYIAANQFDPTALEWKQDASGDYLLQITPDKWDLIQSLQMNMFYKTDEGYIDLGLDNIYEFTDDGYLKADTEGTWVSIDGQPVAYYYESTIIENGVRTITGRVPAYLNGERVNLIIVFEDDNYGYIAGASYDYAGQETETVPKALTELAEGDQIDFICDFYSFNGEYLDSYYLGDETMIYSPDWIVSDTYVGGEAVVTYMLTDIYAAEYWTEPVTVG